MNPIGTSSIVFVTLSGLFWGGWLVGSQTEQGQEALAMAYAAYSEQQRQVVEDDLFNTEALRVFVCGVDGQSERPCLAVAAAGRMFIVDAGQGAAAALAEHRVGLGRLQAVLLTNDTLTQSADLDDLLRAAMPTRSDVLAVYGPADTQGIVNSINAALDLDGSSRGLQAWAPAPEPGQPVIVFEADGLIVSAFTHNQDGFSGKVGYRFDYRGRSLVVAGNGQAEWAEAAQNVDVVLHSAQSQALADLGISTQDTATAGEVAQAAQAAGAGMVVLTGAPADSVAADLQVREARAAGMTQAIAGRIGMMLELPLINRDVNVRSL